MPDLSFLLIAGLAVFLGSLVQGSVGLGLGLVAAPVVSFLEPALMPGTVLVATLTLPVCTVASEWRHIDWRGVGWALPARLPGAVAGTWLVAVVAPSILGVLVGVMVLIAVAASLSAVEIRKTPLTLAAAGLAAGAAGTATSVDGPPLALVYQHEPARVVRASLGAFFLVGVSLSLTVLAVGGHLTREQVTAGLLLAPGILAGYFSAIPVHRRYGTARIRTALLCVVSVSGVALITHALTG